MEQIREELRNINESLQTIECALAEIEPTLEEGQYWKWEHTNFPITKGTVIRISVVNETTVTYMAINGSISGNCGIVSLRQNARLLSDDEVEQALIEEAERRELLENKFLTPGGFTIHPEASDLLIMDYNTEYDVLQLKGDSFKVNLCKRGDWAETIEDEWEIEKTPYLRIRKGGLVINCEHETEPEEGFERREAIEIRDALNNMED